MEKVNVITEQIEIQKHSFYCDKCGEYLGTSEEHNDGWYKRFGEFELKFYIDNWYSINKCLCDKCEIKFINNLKAILKNMGFQERG